MQSADIPQMAKAWTLLITPRDVNSPAQGPDTFRYTVLEPVARLNSGRGFAVQLYKSTGVFPSENAESHRKLFPAYSWPGRHPVAASDRSAPTCFSLSMRSTTTCLRVAPRPIEQGFSCPLL